MFRLNVLLGITICAVLTGEACSQTWSSNVLAVQGTVDALVNTNYAPAVTSSGTLAPGAVSFGEVFRHDLDFGNSGTEHVLDVQPSLDGLQLAPVAFTARATAYAFTQPPPGMTSAFSQTEMEAAVRVELQAPAPTSGRLILRYGGYEADIGHGRMTVDVGGDGSIEVDADTNSMTGYNTVRVVEIPVTVASGLVFDLQFATIASASSFNDNLNSHGAVVWLEAEFHPGQSIVAPFDDTGATANIFFDHGVDDLISVGLSPSVTGLLVFGAQSTSVQWSPLVTQLVTIDAVVYAPTFAAAMPPLPPGSELFCQGLVIDAGGQLRTTRSLRAFWP